jgi:hypothetical protein
MAESSYNTGMLSEGTGRMYSQIGRMTVILNNVYEK